MSGNNGELSKNGEFISGYFQTDNNNTLDLNLPVLVPALVKAGSNVGLATVTTVTNSTGTVLSAAALIARNILRSGPTAAYSDTTDTAANIVAAIPNAQVGTGFEVIIANQVAFADTLVAGTGVTLIGNTNMAGSSSRRYVLNVTSLSPAAVTLTGINSGGI